MDLKPFIKSLKTVDDLQRFASDCETTVGHLKNVMYGLRPCSPELAVLIECFSHGAVSRKELRPNDWRRFWPELDEGYECGPMWARSLSAAEAVGNAA